MRDLKTIWERENSVSACASAFLLPRTSSRPQSARESSRNYFLCSRHVAYTVQINSTISQNDHSILISSPRLVATFTLAIQRNCEANDNQFVFIDCHREFRGNYINQSRCPHHLGYFPQIEQKIQVNQNHFIAWKAMILTSWQKDTITVIGTGRGEATSPNLTKREIIICW